MLVCVSSYFSPKDGKDPDVLPDDQYPEWLWHMLVIPSDRDDLQDPKVTPDEWETRKFEGITEKDMQAYQNWFASIIG